MAFKIFNNWEAQAKLEKAQRHQAKYHFSATALHGSKPQSSDREKNSSRPCYKCGKEGHWACSCPKPWPPLGPSPNYGIKGHWKVDCPHLPLGIQTLPSGPKEESLDPALPRLLGLTTEDRRCPGPQAPTLITSMEPRVTLTMAGKQISFLINTGATYSAMPAYSGKTEVSQISVVGVDSLVPTPQITKPLPCTLQNTPLSHFFLHTPKMPHSNPWKGSTLQIQGSLFQIFLPDLAWLLLLKPTISSPPPLPSFSINPADWDTDNPSIASHHTPVYIRLKDPTKFPNQPQYPISQIHQQGLSPSSLSCCLCPTHSPYNMPILLLKSQMAPTAWFKT